MKWQEPVTALKYRRLSGGQVSNFAGLEYRTQDGRTPLPCPPPGQLRTPTGESHTRRPSRRSALGTAAGKKPLTPDRRGLRLPLLYDRVHVTA